MPPRLVQTAGGFFILQLLLLLISVSQADLFITDTSGRPVTGASICTDNTLIGISDSRGEVSLPDGTDSVEVRALGYETWEGAIPPSGDIFLTAVPVPSGMVAILTVLSIELFDGKVVRSVLFMSNANITETQQETSTGPLVLSRMLLSANQLS